MFDLIYLIRFITNTMSIAYLEKTFIFLLLYVEIYVGLRKLQIGYLGSIVTSRRARFNIVMSSGCNL